MITSTQGATRLAPRCVPNRVFGFGWIFPTAATVNQRWYFSITIPVIVVLATLIAHSHSTTTADVRTFPMDSDPAVIALNDLATRGAPVTSHCSHRSRCGCVRHARGVQEFRFPQDPNSLPLSHARRSYPRGGDPKCLPREIRLGATRPMRSPFNLSFFGQEAVRFIVIRVGL